MPRRHPTLYQKRPLKPLALTVSTVPALPDGVSQLRLQWTPALPGSPVLYTEVYFSNGTFRGLVSPGVNTFTDTGLAANTTYTYYVLHVVGGARSQPSNTAAGTTQLPFTAPTTLVAAQVLALPAGVSSIDLTWHNTTGDYVNLYRTPGGFVATLPPGTQAYRDSGLAANTSYSYQVQHVRFTDIWYGTALSNSASATTQVQFNAPIGLTVTQVALPNGASQLQLTWTNAQSDLVQLFRGGAYIGAVAAGQPPSFLDTGLAPATSYSYVAYHLRFTDAWYYAGPSNTASNTTGLPTPTGVSVTPVTNDQTLRVGFTIQTGSAQHEIYLNGSYYTTLGAGTNLYDVAGLSAGSQYYIQVAALLNGQRSLLTGPVYGRPSMEMIITSAPGGNYSVVDSGGYRTIIVTAGAPVSYQITRAGALTRLLVARGGNAGPGTSSLDIGGGGGGGSDVFQATDVEPAHSGTIQVGETANDANTYYRDTVVSGGGWGTGSPDPDSGWGGNGGYSGRGYAGGLGGRAGAGNSAGGGGGGGAAGPGVGWPAIENIGGAPGPGITAWDGVYYGRGGYGGRGNSPAAVPANSGWGGDANLVFGGLAGANGVAKFRWPIAL